MEHSYSKDIHPKGNVEVMATRSILIPRPPQCPSCYQHSTNDDILAVRKSFSIIYPNDSLNCFGFVVIEIGESSIRPVF